MVIYKYDIFLRRMKNNVIIIFPCHYLIGSFCNHETYWINDSYKLLRTYTFHIQSISILSNIIIDSDLTCFR